MEPTIGRSISNAFVGVWLRGHHAHQHTDRRLAVCNQDHKDMCSYRYGSNTCCFPGSQTRSSSHTHWYLSKGVIYSDENCFCMSRIKRTSRLAGVLRDRKCSYYISKQNIHVRPLIHKHLIRPNDTSSRMFHLQMFKRNNPIKHYTTSENCIVLARVNEIHDTTNETFQS